MKFYILHANLAQIVLFAILTLNVVGVHLPVNAYKVICLDQLELPVWITIMLTAQKRHVVPFQHVLNVYRIQTVVGVSLLCYVWKEIKTTECYHVIVAITIKN